MKREGQNYSIPYFETSAKDGTKIVEALREMLSLSIENEKNTDLIKGMEGNVLDKDNMFDTNGVYLNKKNESISSKNNGGCNCYTSWILSINSLINKYTNMQLSEAEIERTLKKQLIKQL